MTPLIRIPRTRDSPVPPPRQPLHFFRIMLHSTIDQEKLMIPTKFARRIGHELSEVAKLVVPNGNCWEMGLEKDNNRIWFKSGWQEFMKFHSICFGHLLVFRYEEKSTFHVCIFDTTLTEIDYPCGVPNSNIMDHNLENQPKGKNVYITRSSGKLKENVDSSPRDSPVEIHEQDTELLLPRGFPFTNSILHKIPKETEKAATIASLRELENPSFLVILRASNIQNKIVHVPMKFVEKHLKKCREFIHLMVHGKKQKWSVRCFPRKDSPSSKQLGHGWHEFAVDNNLVEGDVCVFELIKKGKDIALKVWIYHAVDYAGSAKKRYKLK